MTLGMLVIGMRRSSYTIGGQHPVGRNAPLHRDERMPGTNRPTGMQHWLAWRCCEAPCGCFMVVFPWTAPPPDPRQTNPSQPQPVGPLPPATGPAPVGPFSPAPGPILPAPRTSPCAPGDSPQNRQRRTRRSNRKPMKSQEPAQRSMQSCPCAPTSSLKPSTSLRQALPGQRRSRFLPTPSLEPSPRSKRFCSRMPRPFTFQDCVSRSRSPSSCFEQPSETAVHSGPGSCSDDDHRDLDSGHQTHPSSRSNSRSRLCVFYEVKSLQKSSTIVDTGHQWKFVGICKYQISIVVIHRFFFGSFLDHFWVIVGSSSDQRHHGFICGLF